MNQPVPSTQHPAHSVAANPNRKQRLLLAVAPAALIGAALSILLTRGAFAVPFSDEISFHRLYSDALQGEFRLKEIFATHNIVHLYALLKSWFWLVVHYGLDWRTSMYAQVALIAATIVLVAHYAVSRAAPDVRTIVVFSISLALGSARQHENLFWAMQISSAAMVFFSLLAFALVARFAETQSTKHAAPAVVAGILALLSAGGGMLSFPITIAALAVLSKKHWQRAMFIAIGAAIMLALFQHLPHLEHSGQLPYKDKAQYIMMFFSNALASFGRKNTMGKTAPGYSILLGAVIVAFALYAVASSWSERKKHIFPYLIIMFSLALAASVVHSRGSIWRPMESRYYPFASLLLVGIILLVSHARTTLQRRLLHALAILIAISFLQSYFLEYRRAPKRHAHASQAHSLICNGDIRGLQEQLFRLDPQRHTNMEVMQTVFCTTSTVNPTAPE